MPKYTIALSFSGEEREFAESIAQILRENEVAVFYDRFEQHDLWGKDLYETLRGIYVRECRYVLLFISHSYLSRMWTVFERKQIIDRLANEHGQECILPVRVNGCMEEVPGLSNGIGYISVQSDQPNIVGNLILKKLNQEEYRIDSTQAYKRALEVLKANKEGVLEYNQILTSVEHIKTAFPKRVSGEILNFVGSEFYWKRENGHPLILLGKNDIDVKAKNRGLIEICRFSAPEAWIGIGRFAINWPRATKRKKDDSPRLLILLYLYSTSIDDMDTLVGNDDAMAAFLAGLYLDEINTEEFNQRAEQRFVALR